MHRDVRIPRRIRYIGLASLFLLGFLFGASSNAQYACLDSICTQFLPSTGDQDCGVQGCTMVPTIPQVSGGTAGDGTEHLCLAAFTCTGGSECAQYGGSTYEVTGNPGCCIGNAICTESSCYNYNASDPSCCTDPCNPDCPSFTSQSVCNPSCSAIYDPSNPACSQPPTCSAGSCVNCAPPACDPPQSWSPQYCECYTYPSPILIDTDGSGFHLTSASEGVLFDFFGNGKPIQISWTAPGSTNGWLALDRNGNGKIDSAKELFGNITEQPQSTDPNGFLALAVFDEPQNGGNGDGIIDSHDAIWPKLLVWIDANHDGISQPEELHHLDEVGIHSIGLMYRESRRVDEYGNEFRYKGRLDPDRGDNVNRVIYDVILQTGNAPQ